MGSVENMIINADESVEKFLEQWRQLGSYVDAHTSGSTGKPKAITLLKADMLRSAEATNEFFGITAGDWLRCPLSCDYIAGKMMVVRALAADATVDCSREFAAAGCSRRIKLMAVVPAQIDKLLESAEIDLVDNLLVGGAPLSSEMERRLIDRGVNAYASYGMTETCSHVALRHSPSAVYEALPGIRFAVDDRSCLIVESESMSFGRLVTNDIVDLLAGNRFRWKGRFDNAINSGGVKVYAEEIEQLIAPLLPSGVSFYVSHLPHDRWGQQVVVVADRDIDLSAIDFNGLTPAQRPRRVIVHRMAYTSNGKLRRIPAADI